MIDEQKDGTVTPDVFDDGGGTPDEGALKELSELALRQILVEEEIARLAAELKEASEVLGRISREYIPEKMREIGMESFTLSTGEKVAVVKTVKASIPKDQVAEAHAWLREKGFDIIKNNVTASFVKGEESAAIKLLADLEARGLVVDHKEFVHHSTLGAFVREQLREGADLPSDLFGIFEVTNTKIERGRS